MVTYRNDDCNLRHQHVGDHTHCTELFNNKKRNSGKRTEWHTYYFCQLLHCCSRSSCCHWLNPFDTYFLGIHFPSFWHIHGKNKRVQIDLCIAPSLMNEQKERFILSKLKLIKILNETTQLKEQDEQNENRRKPSSRKWFPSRSIYLLFLKPPIKFPIQFPIYFLDTKILSRQQPCLFDWQRINECGVPSVA